jgi:hypothetical protein
MNPRLDSIRTASAVALVASFGWLSPSGCATSRPDAAVRDRDDDVFGSARALASTLRRLRAQCLADGRWRFFVVDFEKARYRTALAPEVADARENLETDCEFSTWCELPTGIRFDEMTFDDGGRKNEGVVWAPFDPNGLPQGFVVRLVAGDLRVDVGLS